MLSPSLTIIRGTLISLAAAALVGAALDLPAADKPPSKDSKPIEGIWQGTLKAGAFELRVIFKISKAAGGELHATLDSPDQGAKDIPFDSVARDGSDVKLEAKKLVATFQGTLSDDGQAIKGQWKQAGATMPLALVRLDKEPETGRPQDPKKPYPYVEEEVSYENASAKVKLAGTLTLPKSRRPAPAVLLITGSGPQDRDESIMGHRPFLVLADSLTRRGIAVLRVDDRGVGGSTGQDTAATTEDLTGDVLAGVAYLKTRQEIDPRRIGLAGHSEGGIIAPLAASRSRDVAFIVLLAGTGVTGEEILYRQGDLIIKAQGANAELAAANRTTQKALFEIVKQEADPAKAEPQLRQALLELSGAKTALAESKEAIEAQCAAQAKALSSPWLRFFLTFDPATALHKVRCPVLAINGEHDLQVDPKQNLPPIEAALKQAGNRDVTVKELAGLNHLFQHSKTGSPAEYGKIDETFAPEALEIIGNWIVERTK